MIAPTIARVPEATADTRSAAAEREPLRVMHVVYRLQAGGMEYGVVKLVNGLDRSRIHSSVCSTTPATDVKRLLHADVPLFECRRRAGNDPRVVAELVKLFRREQPHIVHTHAWGTLVEGLLAARLARVPQLVHGEHGTLQVGPLQRRVQRLVWSRADQVLSVSSRLAERMAAATGFPRDRITTIRNGVDTSRFGHLSQREARARLGLTSGGTIIGTVGRLVPVKDHASLVHAVARLRDRGSLVTAVIAGEGPLRAALAAQIDALKLHQQVRLLGHRPDPETVLAALDIFVLPSRSEGLSNTVLEAMASRLPVVATSVGGNDELIEDGITGLLLPPGDPEALAEGLGLLLASTEKRAHMGQAAVQRARTRFSIEAMIQNYERLYLESSTHREPKRSRA
jgi:sugar transferase (PEP-CTERM/EpsH1 system associated)